MTDGSLTLRAGFILLTATLGFGFVIAVRGAAIRLGMAPHAVRRFTLLSGLGTLAWIGATAGLAAAGALRFGPFPPTMLGLLLLTFVLAVAIGRSSLGRTLALGLPLGVLVGSQAFRVAVELLLHRAYVEGLMPVQMSYSGFNFDIVTGILAASLGLALVWVPVPAWVVRAWNVVGFLLLLNVLVIALLSAPTPFRQFHNEPANVWITRFPWVWLPTVMVLAALIGHLLVFRRQRATSAAPAEPPLRAGRAAGAGAGADSIR